MKKKLKYKTIFKDGKKTKKELDSIIIEHDAHHWLMVTFGDNEDGFKVFLQQDSSAFSNYEMCCNGRELVIKPQHINQNRDEEK